MSLDGMSRPGWTTLISFSPCRCREISIWARAGGTESRRRRSSRRPYGGGRPRPCRDCTGSSTPLPRQPFRGQKKRQTERVRAGGAAAAAGASIGEGNYRHYLPPAVVPGLSVRLEKLVDLVRGQGVGDCPRVPGEYLLELLGNEPAAFNSSVSEKDDRSVGASRLSIVLVQQWDDRTNLHRGPPTFLGRRTSRSRSRASLSGCPLCRCPASTTSRFAACAV
jgi:hypothetical protein